MKRVGRDPAVIAETLDSWKAIAAYLRRDVRTVMRWEQQRGLPTHRLPGGGKPGVYALKSELDAWLNKSRLHLAEPAEAAAPVPSIAVLPFSNLSGDKENEYFSDGLADEVITALTRIAGLRVTARTSSFAFRGEGRDVREIGRKLGVRTLLEGSVQRSGERIRVSAQLVDTADGFHVWSERYDRELRDVFEIQDEISRAIAQALEVRLAPSPGAPRKVNLEAYNHWLKGRYYQQYENFEALAKSRSCFEQAIALDSSFPQPYIGLASLWRAAADFGVVRPEDVAIQARAAIRKALELDSSCGEAYALCGTYRAWIDFDWKGAEADFARALELTPASPLAQTMFANSCLIPINRLDEAERRMERAVESDPLSPLAYCLLAKVLLWKREYSRAQARIDAAFELRPDYPLAVWYRGAGLWFEGRIEEGVACLQAAARSIGGNPSMSGSIGNGLGLLGRRDEALQILAELHAAARERYVSPIGCAWVYMGLGELDEAFAWLDRAVDERDPHILDFPCKPLYDRLRQDARFTALLRKMRLA